MNEILHLKGKINSFKRNGKVGDRLLPKNQYVTLNHLLKLKTELLSVYDYWNSDTLLDKKLISVYYKCLVAKSNRMQSFFKNCNETIVGAKFASTENFKHIITHCLNLQYILNAINIVSDIITICNKNNWKTITNNELIMIKTNRISLKNISKSLFIGIIVDSFYIEDFGIEIVNEKYHENAIISLYDTGIPTDILFNKIGLNYLKPKTLNETTLLLDSNQYTILKEKAPFLIAMSVKDINELEIEEILTDDISNRTIRKPSNEPVIGVIDYPFDKNVYFSEWVEYKNMIDSSIPLNSSDFDHGTKVSSIIVDGDSLNPQLDDGCGKFRVRHFGVACGRSISSFSIMRSIKEIIAANTDIKVWNLSLGTSREISNNFISPEASLLDEIQTENDVIFVISGTNKLKKDENEKRIGIPADSINSIVVNSVDSKKNPAPYSRKGPVLSFYVKPDISYYGGVTNEEIKTYAGMGISKVTGTSFAAPWIARKLAFLIHKMNFSREVAKALLIDSAITWNKNETQLNYLGNGVVPIHINEILKSKKNEIKFIISDKAIKFETSAYNIPIPRNTINNISKFPYISKATLCYFPKCTRNQGVDYVNTELDLHFGRIENRNGRSSIKTINNNTQNEKIAIGIKENEARKFFRKWDNVKSLVEYYSNRKRAKFELNSPYWGFRINMTERLGKKHEVQFGLVITLRNIENQNRIDEFIQQCSMQGWLVNKINIENQLNIYNKADVDIEFEET